MLLLKCIWTCPAIARYTKFVLPRPLRIVILGEYSPTVENHHKTDLALSHSAAKLRIECDSEWVSTDAVTGELLSKADALWITTGLLKNQENAIGAIKTARRNGIPTLGTCGGFQHMVLEYARNVLEIYDAQHVEYHPTTGLPLISEFACSLKGKVMNLTLLPNSRAESIYGGREVKEHYYCKFGINSEYNSLFHAASFRPIGFDAAGEIRILDLQHHPFFLGTLFVPQARSTAEEPHPIISGWLTAAMQ